MGSQLRKHSKRSKLMASPKLHADTLAIVEAIANATSTAKAVSDHVADELHQHTINDDKRFEVLTVLVESISRDTQSLLKSRSYIKGAWKGIVGTALAASGVFKAGEFVINHWK